MKVNMLVHGSGPDGAVKPGSEVVVSDSHGEELIAGGYAEEVPEPEPEEPAAEEAPEPEADESPEGADAEPVADEPAEVTAEPEPQKKTTRRRRTAKKSA